MKRVASGLLVLLLVPAALLALRSPAAAGTAPSELASGLDARLGKVGVSASRFGVAVLELGATPRVAYARGHTNVLPPASVAKLFVAAVALDRLGPGYAFRTRLTARGRVEGGVLHGDLVAHGSGDPSLDARFSDGRPLRVFEQFADAVRRAGIARVTGCLVLDDGRFDREFHHATWSAGDRARWYGAPVGGLSFNDSCLDVEVLGAAAAGDDATLRFPATTGPWRVQRGVTTRAEGRVSVGASWSGDTLRVTGSLPRRTEYSFSHPVPDPLAYFGGALLATLESAGVVVQGAVRPARDAEDRRPGREVARHESALLPALEVMNQRSQNFYAASIFKAAGAVVTGQGSWTGGQRAVDDMLRRRGLSDDGRTAIVDGAGLSLDNRTTAATVARLLADFDADPLRGPWLRRSLAVPGQPGTLDDRFLERGLGERLHAKTGTLAQSGVHSLAGYLDGRDGHPGYAFAILVRHGKGRDLIAAVMRELAKH